MRLFQRWPSSTYFPLNILCHCTAYCALAQHIVPLHSILCPCTSYCALAQHIVPLHNILCHYRTRWWGNPSWSSSATQLHTSSSSSFSSSSHSGLRISLGIKFIVVIIIIIGYLGNHCVAGLSKGSGLSCSWAIDIPSGEIMFLLVAGICGLAG